MKAILNLTYPCVHGLIEDWDLMEEIWKYMFAHELRIDPEGSYTMLTEAPRNPK